MKTDYVIIDTNIIRADFNFASQKYQCFRDYLHRTGTTLVIPDIVLVEANELFNKELNSKLKNLQNAIREFTRLSGENLDDEVEHMSYRVVNYEEIISQKLAFGFKKIFYKLEYLPEIIRRSVKRIKPFSNKGEEFRDCILWLTILDFIEHNKDYKIVFISENTADFGKVKNELHDDLKNQLKERKLQLEFFSNLSDFIQVHASLTNWLTKDWLAYNLDWTKLQCEIFHAVQTINCSYFFELFNRVSLSKAEAEFYEVSRINVYQNIIDYYLIDSTDNFFKINVGFYGEATVKYKLTDDSTEVIVTEFYTETIINCTSDDVLSYSGEYFEETSGLVLSTL